MEARQIDIYNPKKISLESIGSLAKLASCLDVTLEEIQEAQELSASERYKIKETPKRDGSLRKVYSPHFLIRKIQRRINARILSNSDVIAWPDHIFGSVPNQHCGESLVVERDYISCARRHCGAKSVLTLDIRNFFDNIHQSYVENIFTEFLKYDVEVSKVLSDLCCLDGHVVQGALTSSYIASLCLWDVEGELVVKLGHKNLVYTRYVDDMNVSSVISDYDFTYAVRAIEVMLDKKGLPLNPNKTKIQHISTEPLTVHGLRIGFKEPRLPSSEVRNIRAAVKNIEILASEHRYRTSHAFRKDFNRCMGRVNKLGRIGHNQHQKLVLRLKKVIPLPSKKDIVRAKKIVERLEKDYSANKSTFWYMKRFYLAHERLNILQRTYFKTSAELRGRLKSISPTYGF
ncbi:reverse transcriptase family protein [Acidithiobacillus ferrivorans]|uniref:RNA-directed DNA polymerase n=1 Tax=Acidithiobacillus ferrivorans TaxID=160808 RepID=A0A7T5BI69_9PROT|nr:reverse transcriptase family protein [Acidithiobacillus ferrivorans]QQD74141.1 RNA-directed DNA polymerase [Acidithiobacillus ferrivorans]